MIKTTKDFWRLYPEQFSDLGKYPNMTDKHSPEAVVERLRKEIGVEGWQNLCHVEDGLNALRPGDRLPNGNVVEQGWQIIQDYSGPFIKDGFVFVPTFGAIRVHWKQKGQIGAGWYAVGSGERIYGATHIRPLMGSPDA